MLTYMLRSFARETATQLEEQTLHLFNGDGGLQLHHEVANATIAASRDRRMNAGHAGLIEVGAKRAFLNRMKYHKGTEYMRPDLAEGHADALVKDFMHCLEFFRPVVLQRLKEEQEELFPQAYYAVLDEADALVTEHPMATFGKFLDEVEHMKDVDKEFYAASFRKKRTVTALYRVGLACLPPERWKAQVTLRKVSKGVPLWAP